MMKTVIVERLTKCYGDKVVLKSVSLELEVGKVYGLVGRNGSGKSVLMKCIAGLVCSTHGSIVVLGKRVGHDVDFAPNTGIAIEQPGLLLKRSAMDNVRILAALTGKPDISDLTRLIELVGLDPNEKKPTAKYSMGMKQRLSIAIALLGDPRILLLDEPMSNLDMSGANDMRALFRKLAATGKTICIATHIQTDISDLCDDIYIMEAGAAKHERIVG